MRVVDDELARLIFGPETHKRLQESGLEWILGVADNDSSGDCDRALAQLAGELVALEQRQRRAAALIALGEMGAGVIHELRNILATIQGFAQVAQRKMERPDKITELLELIASEAQRGAENTAELLSLTRGEGIGFESLDVSELIHSATRLVRHQLSVNRVALETELAEAGLHVLGSRTGLLQVLLNLILNAQQAMPEGGVITLASAGHGDRVVLSVSDTGIGVPEELRERIFEPLFTTKPEGVGTGIGLAMSASVVAQHDGTLRVEDVTPHGARFIIDLPASPH